MSIPLKVKLCSPEVKLCAIWWKWCGILQTLHTIWKLICDVIMLILFVILDDITRSSKLVCQATYWKVFFFGSILVLLRNNLSLEPSVTYVCICSENCHFRVRILRHEVPHSETSLHQQTRLPFMEIEIYFQNATLINQKKKRLVKSIIFIRMHVCTRVCTGMYIVHMHICTYVFGTVLFLGLASTLRRHVQS